MAQYKTGTVSVVNGSTSVLGTDTLWSTEVRAGDLFTIVGTGITYEVASVTDNTTLSLTGSYQGETSSGVSYVIARDFTPIDGIPYINKGDIETAAILKRAIMQLDGSASNTSAGASFEKQHNGDGTHKTFDVSASSLTNSGTSTLTGAVTLGSTLSLGGVTRGSWGEDVISGTATDGTSTTLSDSTKNLGINSLAGMILHITGGTGSGQVRTIASNTSNVITVSEVFSTTPNTTSTYKVYAISNQTLSQVVEKEGAQGCIGNIMNPMTYLPLMAPNDAVRLQGDFQYLCESDTTHIDRYGVLHKNAYYSGTPTDSSEFSITDSGASFGDLTDYVVYLTDGSNEAYRRVDVATGKPIAFAPNAYKLSKPRFGKDGLLVEGVSTNQISNNTMQGASPGNLPNGWVQFGAGISVQVVGTGVEDGIDYIDLRLHSESAEYAFAIAFATVISIPAAEGETWTESLFATLVAGSLVNVDNISCRMYERGVGGVDITSGESVFNLTSGALGASRKTYTRTLSGEGVAFVVPSFYVNAKPGKAVDFTVRIGMPQLEKLPFATSVIPTYGTAVTRASTNAGLNGANFVRVSDDWAVICDVTLSGLVANNVIWSVAVPVLGHLPRLLVGSTGLVTVAGSSTNVSTVDALSSGTKYRIGVRHKAGLTSIWVDGVKLVESAQEMPDEIPTSFAIGRIPASSSHGYAYVGNIRIFDNALSDHEMKLA